MAAAQRTDVEGHLGANLVRAGLSAPDQQVGPHGHKTPDRVKTFRSLPVRYDRLE
jgi:hypothetical protein